MAQDPGILQPLNVHVILQDDMVLSQGSGFISTQHVNSAEVLNRVQILYNRLLFTHRNSTLGQTGGHDHRQHLRCQADSDGDTVHESVYPVSVGDTVDDEHRGNHDQHEFDQNP